MLVPEEISLLLSSDADMGAINKSKDGSYFEVHLESSGIEIPEDALSCQLSCESATVWWTVPNITEANNKMYITGPSRIPQETEKVALGYPINSTFEMSIITQYPDPPTSLLEFNDEAGLPSGAWLVGDTFRPNSGVETGFLYVITEIQLDTSQSQRYVVSGLLEQNLNPSTGSFSRLRNDVVQNYAITIPNGLYDLNGLDQSILRELENAGAKNDPNVLFSLSPDEATNKVEIRFNYDSVSIDFTQPNTFREILGFNSQVVGPYATVPRNILADNVAAFNQVNYFIIHSDLTNSGIRFNNQYDQAVAQVLIDVAPGSQIVSTPYNPPRIMVDELVNTKRDLIRMWLTDDKNRRINTNSENWSCRLLIKYLRPYFIGR